MKVIIIGAGIGGLTTGIALEQQDIETQIYEADQEIQLVGAGIWMATNAMQVFNQLGTAQDILNKGIALDHISITDHRLRTIQKTEMGWVRDKFGFSITSIARNQLREVLLDYYPQKVNLGKQLTHWEDDGKKVTAHFEDGTSVEADLLIGADGIHSAVRRQMIPEAKLRYSGQTCWRGIAPISLSSSLSCACVEAWGKTGRFGFSVISPEEVYWFAVRKAPLGEKDPPEGPKAKLQKQFANFASPIPGIIAVTPDNRIIRNDISDLKPIPHWSQGRVLLMGDAAHAPTPNMGQGGGQAVEDAWHLAQILSEEKAPAKAFTKFEAQRRKKVDYVVRMSWMIGKMAHISFGQGLRNFVLRNTPEKVARRQMEWLFLI